MTLSSLFFSQMRRELLLQIKQIKTLIHFSLFFMMFLFFFPLTLKPEISVMRGIAPGLIWLALLMSMLISAERLFQQDYDNGVSEQWLVSGYPLTLIVSAKIIAHWLLFLPPLLAISSLTAILFSLSLWESWILLLSLVCGTPSLLFLCALASSFGVGISQKGALMALILVPLSIPILIFGSAALTMAMNGLAVHAYIALLLAFSILAAGLLPFAIASVIRISHVD